MVLCTELKLSLDLHDCVCALCKKEATVGKILKKRCFYISMNDRLYQANDLVQQISNKMIKQTALYDALISQLTAEAYVRFRHPSINLNITKSKYFERKSSIRNQCLKLNIDKNFTIYDDSLNGCTPEPSIVRTKEYRVIVGKHATKSHYGKYFAQYPFLKKQPAECAEGVIKNSFGDRCVYFEDRASQCEFLKISTPEQFRLVEDLAVEHFTNLSSNRCRHKVRYAKCMLIKEDESDKFIVFIDNTSVFDFGVANYFAITEHRKGYFLGQVSKRRMTFLTSSTFDDPVMNSFIQRSRRLCIRDENLTRRQTSTLPSTRIAVSERTTVTPILNSTSGLEEIEKVAKHRESATTEIFILTSVLSVLGIIGIFLCKFWDHILDIFCLSDFD